MTVRANYEDVVMLSVIGEIVSPRHAVEGFTITNTGQPIVVTRSGGITYNVRTGDRAIGWASDHTEPGVSIRNRDDGESAALATLACIGNDAFVATGEGKGSKVTVAGKHGGNRLNRPRGQRDGRPRPGRERADDERRRQDRPSSRGGGPSERGRLAGIESLVAAQKMSLAAVRAPCFQGARWETPAEPAKWERLATYQR